MIDSCVIQEEEIEVGLRFTLFRSLNLPSENRSD